MQDHVTIWDGIEFTHVHMKEAKKLAKADKAQICEPFLAATELKFREEFSGYKAKATPEPNLKAKPGPKPKAKETSVDEV